MRRNLDIGRLFHALGDPTRRAIFEAVAERAGLSKLKAPTAKCSTRLLAISSRAFWQFCLICFSVSDILFTPSK